MPVPFDTATYPLLDSTKLKPELGTVIDRMDDGSLGLRVLGSAMPAVMDCHFAPMDEAKSAAFHAYLKTNRATKFTLTDSGTTYSGYIDSKGFARPVSDGVLRWWRVRFVLSYT